MTGGTVSPSYRVTELEGYAASRRAGAGCNHFPQLGPAPPVRA
jgi:hypothetical protein